MKLPIKTSIIMVFVILILNTSEAFSGFTNLSLSFLAISDNTVGVPLDGGLLALLAGAGAAYVTVRRKKKAG